MIKLICFDLDGVLSDTSWIHAKAFRNAVKAVADIDLTEADEKLLHARSTKSKLQLMEESGWITVEQIGLINTQKQEETAKLVCEFVVPDVQKIGLLKNLKARQIKVVCVSNCIRSTVELILRQMGCLKYFDYIVSNEDVTNPKPDPEGYIKAMQRFYMTEDETLIVEDSDVGWQAALASGATGLRVLNSTNVTIKNLDTILCV